MSDWFVWTNLVGFQSSVTQVKMIRLTQMGNFEQSVILHKIFYLIKHFHELPEFSSIFFLKENIFFNSRDVLLTQTVSLNWIQNFVLKRRMEHNQGASTSIFNEALTHFVLYQYLFVRSQMVEARYSVAF